MAVHSQADCYSAVSFSVFGVFFHVIASSVIQTFLFFLTGK